MIYIQAIAVLAVLGGALCILLLIADRFLCNYGPCQVTINDKEPFTVEGGCKLLDALYQAKIYIPSACGGQGTCGFCKVQLFEGGGPVLPTELPYLDDEELANSTRLACQVKVKADVSLHVKEEFLNVQEFTAEVTAARLVTADTREIRLRLVEPQEIDFHPGQYVQIFVPGAGDTTFRAYSVASPPRERNEIELLVRLVPGGLGSTYLHEVEVGDQVRFTGPYGEFEMAPESTELICVGGGCGMAPMRSILRHVRDVSPGRKCALFFGARTASDAMYLQDFTKLRDEMPDFDLHYALSEPERSPEWDGETGFIHESVAQHVSEGSNRQAFLCGPPQMIEATINVLVEKGIPRDQIFYDEF